MVASTGRSRDRLLICGILAALLWVGTDIVAGTLWDGYNFISQSISDLSAIGSPTRLFVFPLNLVCNILFIAFGLSVWRLAGRKRSLRLMASMVVGNAVLSGLASAFFPNHLGEAASSNNIGVILGAAGMFLSLLAIGFGAAAYRNWFRFLSIGILLTFLVLTILGLLRPQIAEGQPVSLVGLQERTMAYGYLLWVLVLAVVLLRARRTGNTELIMKSVAE
jgi:hypothetical protein